MAGDEVSLGRFFSTLFRDLAQQLLKPLAQVHRCTGQAARGEERHISARLDPRPGAMPRRALEYMQCISLLLRGGCYVLCV
jgi:hypothetical protein